MSEVTMLSRMVASGLICTFQCNGDVSRSLMLTVRIAGRTKEHVYVVPHEMGTSKLITLAWADWRPYAEDSLVRDMYA